MGYTTYSLSSRESRTASYVSQSINDTFEQNKIQRIHESMKPQTVKVRECRDSTAHPNTVPIILGMDVTGSMGKIPHDLVKTGLPTMMSTLINKGVPDASLLFLAVGDHITDNYPIQVGQFESGDVELDMWLTRTYLEGRGGGNGGESYGLAWDFANRFVQTDAWEKRNQKGFMITFGDEYFHESFPASTLNYLYETVKVDESVSLSYILDEVKKKWNVLHIHVEHTDNAKSRTASIKAKFGDIVTTTEDYTKIPDIIAQFIVDNTKAISISPDAVNDILKNDDAPIL